MAYKKRPFRVDYFDVKEMIDGDMALVRSVVVRAVTIQQATNMVLWDDLECTGNGDYVDGRHVVKTYRFYKKLSAQPTKKVYRSVESLYGEKKALKIMEKVEAHRVATTGTPLSPEAPCDHGNATNAPVGTCAHGEPTSGPDSPATQAAIADLAGMAAHDAHEKTMDTFQPETGRLPGNLVNKLDALDHAVDSGDDIASAILTAPAAVEVCTDPACNVPYGEHVHVDEPPTSLGLPPYEWCPKHPGHYKLNCTSCKIEAAGGIENLKDQIAGYVPGSSRGEPATDGLVLAQDGTPPAAWKESLPLPTWAKLAMFGGIAALVIVIILAILGHPCH